MKKILSLLFTLLIFVGNAWGADCYLVNEATEFNWFMSGSKTYSFSAPASKFSVDVYKTMATAIGSIYFYTSSDNKNWSELAELGVGSLKKNSYKNFSYDINDESVRYIKIEFSGSYTRYFKNVKVTQKKYLTVTAPSSKSLAFGNVEAGTTSSAKTITVSYSSTAANVESTNSAFKVTPTSVGNSSCGKTGTQNVTVTFNPTSVGDQNGKITIGSNTISVSGTGSLAVPAKPSVTMSYSSATVNWGKVEGADGYIVNWYDKNGTIVGSENVSGGNTVSHPISNLAPNGTSYSFSVQSKAGTVASNESEKASGSTLTIPVPTNFRQTVKTYSDITVAWNAVSVEGVTYHIYWDGGNDTSSTNSKSYTGLAHSSTFTNAYVKSVLNVNGKDYFSAASNKIDASTLTLDPPAISSTTVGYDNVVVTWKAAEGATSYVIYLDGNKVEEVSGLTYTVTGLPLGTSHTVKVESKLNKKETTTAKAVNNINTNDLNAPASVVADQDNTSYSSVPLSWSAVTDATGYLIVNNVSGVTTIVDGGSTSEYTVSGLDMNTSYTFNVYPTYNGQRSKNSKTSNSVKTLSMSVDLSSCMIYESTDEYYFEMSAGEFYMPDDNGHEVTDARRTYTKWVTFDIKKWTGYVGSVYDVRMYVKIGDTWQSQYIWNANQESRLGFDSSDYITCTVEVPFNVTAVRFQGSSPSAWWGDWMKYGGNMRYIKNVKVYMGSYASASVSEIDYDVYIGQNDEDNTKTFNLTYANRVTDGAKFNIDNDKFSGTFPTIASCTAGSESNIPVKFYTEELGNQQGGLTIVTGDVATVSLVANVKALPAPKNLAANVTGKSGVTLTWSENLGDDDKASGLASGYYVRVKKGDADYGDPVFVSRNTSGTSYSYNVTGLDEASNYSFKITTIYTDSNSQKIENESAVITAITYVPLTVEKSGEYADAITYTVSGEDGKWNISENSFAMGSKATVTSALDNDCAVFEGITVGDTNYTNPAVITMNAASTATISYAFKGLSKPVVSVSENNSKDNVTITWGTDACVDGYNVYKDDELVKESAEGPTYQFTGLDEATTYSFSVKAVRGSEESEVSAVSATTYTTSMETTLIGIFGNEGTVTVTSDAWNSDENSYSIGSTATVAVSGLHADCVVETIVANGNDISSTAKFTVEAENTVVVTYRYSGTGVAEVVDEYGNVVYGTLTEAVKKAGDGAAINLLTDVAEDLIVSNKIEFNGNGNSIQNLYIKQDGSVELTGDVTVVKDFGLEVSVARSGQFLENGGQIQVTGRAYIDKVLEENGVGDYNKWYSVAVPFQVSIKDGIYIVGNDGSETKAKFNSDYAMFEYDGALRAAGTSRLPEWALADSEKNMKVGTFYLFGLGKSGPNVFRFYKADNAELITLDKTLTLKEYASSKSIDAGWNGIGNSQLYHVGIETTEYQYAQVLENNKFTTVDIAETSFAVTTPMFIQATGDGSVSLNPKKDGTLRSASVSSAVYNIRLAKEGAEKYSDQMFASASSDATGSYTIGRDLVKFEVSTAYPQLYTRGFNTNLSVHEAAYNELSIAEMPLYMFAPEAGNYTLSLGKEVSDGSALYLVKNGAEIHNFNADGAYTLYLAKGTDSSYTLRIKGENGDIPTPVIDNKAGEVNVYIEEGVLVIEGLDNGESYMVGNTIRTLYSGVSSGNNIRIALPECGIYLVNAKESKVKILNK